jgi:hypothetical protein
MRGIDTGSFRQWRSIRRFIVKVAICLVALNVIYVVVQPLNWLDRVTIYNHLAPGRVRFPYQEETNPRSATVRRMEQLFADHEISGTPKAADEFRVVILGGSSLWGVFLAPDQTLSGCLNRKELTTPDGRRIRAYNLAYLAPSILRDLLTLHHALNYQVDQVVWFVGGVGMDRVRMFAHIFVQGNPQEAYDILDTYRIATPASPSPTPPPREPGLWSRTLFEQRDDLSNWLSNQFYGLVWLQTNQDHTARSFRPYSDPSVDSLGDIYDVGVKRGPADVSVDMFMLDGLAAGQAMATKAGAGLTIILDPMWHASASKYRYNGYFPFWYFDLLHGALQDQATANGWDYLDWSSILRNEQFTDSPFHYTPEAACELADRLGAVLRQRSVR